MLSPLALSAPLATRACTCAHAVRTARALHTSLCTFRAPQSAARPLGDISVSWGAAPADIAAARANTHARNMRFDEDEAAELVRIHAALAEKHRETRALESEQKMVGDEIPRAAKAKVPPAELERLRTRARELRARLRELMHAVGAATARSLAIRSAWPNDMHPDVVRGDERASRVVAVCDARRGAAPAESLALPCAVADFDARVTPPREPRADHLAVAAQLRSGDIDMAAGNTATGPSWPYLLGTVALLEHALTQYALKTAVEHGYTPVSVPDVVRTDIAERCGFRPRDEAAAQTYYVSTGKDEALCLAGTAEIPLAALVAGQTYRLGESRGARTSEMGLPLRLVALGHAFRAEAGARGADTRGLYRIHQFSKAEMFVVADAESSDAVLEELRAIQTAIVAGLGLYYRVLDMSSVELGASASRKYDIEVWMRGRGSWGEISSASNCTDYQAHRLGIKYRPADGTKLRYAHTLNATAAAVPRLVLAILETHGTRDGKLVLPEALRPYWLGGEVEWTAAPPAQTTAAAAAAAAPVAAPGSPHSHARTHLADLAARTGADPGALLAAFVVLHELTALVPLAVLAAAFAALGVGARVVDWIERTAHELAPDMLGSRVARARHAGERVGARIGGGAAILADVAAAYMLTKLLAPVRLGVSVALAPQFARAAVVPVIRAARRILSHRV